MVEILVLILAVAYFARRGRGGSTVPTALPSLLRGAEVAGIITAPQREQLLAYAGARDTASGRLGGAAWLGVFAGLFVVAGVALLIARNWDQIGPLVRVVGFLVVLAAVGVGAIRGRERALALSLPLELLWLFLPLLGIGLYGQTFQLTGDPITPYLTWLALTAPIAWWSPRPVVATMHTFAIVVVLFGGNFIVAPVSGLFGGGDVPRSLLALTDEATDPTAWLLSLALLAAVVAQSLYLLPRAHRHHCVGVVLAWVFAILVAPTPFRLRHEGWIVVAAVALATLWVAALVALDTSLEERATSMFVWVGTIYGLTFTWHMDRAAAGATTPAGVLLASAAVVAAFVCTAVVPGRRISPSPTWALAGKALLAAPLAVALLYLGDDVGQVWLAAVAMNVLLLAIAVAAMWHGSLVREPAQVNLGVVVLVGLLVTRFIDVFGSMLRSGIGFIVAGLLLAALSFALERTRRRLIATVPEAVP
jgi:uncharacterized membrane protein